MLSVVFSLLCCFLVDFSLISRFLAAVAFLLLFFRLSCCLVVLFVSLMFMCLVVFSPLSFCCLVVLAVVGVVLFVFLLIFPCVPLLFSDAVFVFYVFLVLVSCFLFCVVLFPFASAFPSVMA